MAKKGRSDKKQAREQARADKRKDKEDKDKKGAQEGGGSCQDGKGVVKRGLANLGNTCFMNSILQCLNVSVHFSDELLTVSSEGLQGLAAGLCTTFKGIRGQEASKTGSGFSPKALHSQLTERFPWFRGGAQHDAHELLVMLLGGLGDERTLGEKKEAKSKSEGENGKTKDGEPAGLLEKTVWNSFKGHMCSAVYCWQCGSVSTSVDRFLGPLSLELPVGGNSISVKNAPVGPMGVSAACMAVAAEVAAASGGSSKEAGSASSASAADEERRAALLEELEGKKKKELAEICKEKGVDAAAMAEALESEKAKKVLKELIVERQLAKRAKDSEASSQKQEQGSEDPEVGLENRLADLRRELEDLEKPSQLKKKAQEYGATESDIEETIDAEDRPQALRDLILAKASKNPKPKTKENGVSQEKQDKKRQKAVWKLSSEDRQRLELVEQASLCEKSLPEDLRELFGKNKDCPRNGHVTLGDCLQRFLSVEALTDDGRPTYACSFCQEAEGEEHRTYASKRQWLCGPLPPVLPIHLKRFQRKSAATWDKSNAGVDLPPTLDFREFLASEDDRQALLASHIDLPKAKKPSKLPILTKDSVAAEGATSQVRYELHAVCIHQGSSMSSGHYIAFVNAGPSLQKEAWYEISDSHVRKTSREQALKAQAYVAFYRREGTWAADDNDEEDDAGSGGGEDGDREDDGGGDDDDAGDDSEGSHD
eukprot:TRINITY_DN47047_c0_g1_i1.p1 TRINITY_DN47047_c0_g1~~TRINITY_DN47047_c0_g1_i1.p1  ORF type:complete len:711 (+),score=261.01 TRINITY_DN47047_c0_g1_i1:92-2224(+)